MGLLCGLAATPSVPSCSNPLPPPPSVTEATVQPFETSTVSSDASNITTADDSVATSLLQRAFRKYSNNNSGEKREMAGEGIMDILSGTKNSPPLTIKRGGHLTKHWQEFIDREQSSVDHLIKDSFAAFCQHLSADESKDNCRPSMNSLPRASKLFSAKNLHLNGNHCGTLPRAPSKFDPSSFLTSSQVAKGIEELEMLYAPMKNLSAPLPNAYKYSGNRMPEPHPLKDWKADLQIVEDSDLRRSCDDDQASEICSVIADIPPALAPVQSHALLEESLGHQIPISPLPRTPMRRPKFSGLDLSKGGPPLPPRRTSSKLSLFTSQRANQITLGRDNSAIYANALPNRTSLMSTGSSEGSSSSSGASVPCFETSEVPPTPLTPNSEREVFSWSNITVWSASPSPSEEHRSVSQIGIAPESEESCNNSSFSSEKYIKMLPRSNVFPTSNPNDRESHYMNVLYEALQRQGGSGSVENAISPYIAIQKKVSNVKNLRHANVDTISAVYASPDEGKCSRRLSSRGSKTRTRSSSATSSSSSTKAVAQFRELMREVERKRLYRVGLNIFNSKPELGIEYLASNQFLELSPPSVAKFFHQNEVGLSKEKIGEYLGNLQSAFAMKVLSFFLQEFNFSGERIDKSLRKLLERVRVPGEAQKIERIMEEFGKRYAKCNPAFVSKLKSAESIVTLSFAIILLNTDLHTPNLKVEKRMTIDDFLNNLKGVDSGRDFDQKLLKSIYRGIKKREFVGGVDHTAQVHQLQLALQQGTSGSNGSDKKPPIQLTEHHRRLVCLCRLYEVTDINSKKIPSAGAHQRDILLFNDLILVSKASANGKNSASPVYSYRNSFYLAGLEVTLFHTPVYHFGIQLSRKTDGAVLLTLNAGSEHDRYKFVMDLQESIFEMDQMEVAMSQLSR